MRWVIFATVFSPKIIIIVAGEVRHLHPIVPNATRGGDNKFEIMMSSTCVQNVGGGLPHSLGGGSYGPSHIMEARLPSTAWQHPAGNVEIGVAATEMIVVSLIYITSVEGVRNTKSV